MNDTSIQILLVEDSAADAVLLKLELAESPFGPFVVTHVKRLSEAVSQCSSHRFDAVLLDLGLPDSQGLLTLGKMRKEAPREIPIVVLTGLHDEALGVRALREGAEDYLVKGSAADSMRARAVRYAIERKRANEAVRVSEERLALVVDAVRMGIFEWNLSTGVVTRSHHHQSLFGVKPEEFEGTFDAFAQRVHSDDRAELQAHVQRSLASLEDYQHEFRVVWPDGTIVWLEVRGKVFADEQKKAARVMGTIVDISKRKAAEEAARAREAELAHLSRITTMGQMASGLAHELNQPLAAILNYASVGLQQIESHPQAPPLALSAIKEVMNETRRAGAIISRMRSFVRKQKPQAVLVDMNNLVREAVRLMEFELRHQGIRPRLDLAENLPKVFGDVVQIEQVLVNLLFNALEAMGEIPSKKASLTVETTLEDDGRNVQVCIIDTGTGMSAENLGRLFQPFFTTKSKGLGMGLNICRSIIESLGGRLSGAPNPDKGMRFCFTVPVAEGV